MSNSLAPHSSQFQGILHSAEQLSGKSGHCWIPRTPERAVGQNSEISVHVEMTSEGSGAKGNCEN